MPEPVPASLLAALGDLVRWLEAAGVPAMVVGGVAASVLGQPRLTQDIDALAVAPEPGWTALAEAGSAYGIVPRIQDAVQFAARSRVLLLRHEPSAIDIDLILGGLRFEEEAVGRSISYDLGGLAVRLPRVEDLLVMKAVAGRPKDLQDMEALLVGNPGVDLEFVRQWVREFAAAMSMPDMLEQLERAITRTR